MSEQSSQATLVHGPDAPPESALRRSLFFIAYAAFITTLAQDKVLGNFPLKFLLKNQLHFTRTEVAQFWFWAGLAWYLKPLAGLIADSFPLLGTRRRWYMIGASSIAALLWILLAVVPREKQYLLGVDILLGLMMVFASTIMGALLVEAGQRYGATGRVSSLREIVQSSCSLIAGPLGGWLSTMAFGLTAGIAAGLLISLAGIAYVFLPEQPVARRDTRVWVEAGEQLKLIGRSYTLWSAALLLTLYFIAPGFSTPLLYLEQDTLKFSQQFIGSIDAFAGAASMCGALVYGLVIRRFNLRYLLAIGIIINALGALLFFFLKSPTSAICIFVVSGFFGTLGVLPLFDLATRSTPRGGEAMGYALMMSVRNIALFGSDWIGSWLIEHPLHISLFGHLIFQHEKFTFYNLIWLNSGSTLLALIAVPLLPRAIMNRREGELLGDPQATGEQISGPEPGMNAE